MLFIIGGASGSGKTSCLPGLRQALPALAWHDFDELGVPTSPIPRDWRIIMTDAVIASSPFMLREPDEPSAWHHRGAELLEGIIEHDAAAIFVAEAGETLAGWLSARGGEFRRNQGAIYLVIGVRDAWTGKGLGRRLLEAGEAWARDLGAHRLELTVLAANHRARLLYERAGFRYEGRKRGALMIDGQPVDEFMMAKTL